MKIELCEDNGFLNDGKPTLVVLVIDGKTRIPYEATKTIQELYQDIAKMPKPKDMSLHENIPVMTIEEEAVNKGSVSITHEIEREDIVKCHRLEKDIDGNVNPELEIGKEYRAINIIKAQGRLVCYEVLDDNANDKIRIPIRPDECQLVRKHFKKPPPKRVFEMIKKCEICKEDNSLLLNKFTNKYEGKCSKCGAKLIELRPVTNA